jgi:hypothetical protein
MPLEVDEQKSIAGTSGSWWFIVLRTLSRDVSDMKIPLLKNTTSSKDLAGKGRSAERR